MIVVRRLMKSQHTHVPKHQEHLSDRGSSTQNSKTQQQISSWKPPHQIRLAFLGVCLTTLAALSYNAQHCSSLGNSHLRVREEAQVTELEQQHQF